MHDQIIKLQGHFKIEKIQDGKVVQEFEKKNQVMARIPALFAGIASGFACDVKEYFVGAVALGTGGTKKDANGKEIPKPVSDDRTMLYSEYDFWHEHLKDSSLPKTDVMKMFVTQCTFGPAQPCKADYVNSTSKPEAYEIVNQGSNMPYISYKKTNNTIKMNYPQSTTIGGSSVYRIPSQVQGQPQDELFHGSIRLQKNALIYEFYLDQLVGNHPDHPDDKAVQYTEAGVYLRLGRNNNKYSLDKRTGNPLGSLFAMRTFPPFYKTSSCALKITWKFVF